MITIVEIKEFKKILKIQKKSENRKIFDENFFIVKSLRIMIRIVEMKDLNKIRKIHKPEKSNDYVNNC